jgi:hypothetical protein
LSNLRWGTPKENAADRKLHGTNKAGAQSPTAKLSETDVLAIRSSTESRQALSARYGVHPSHIYAIRRGTWWKHLPSDGVGHPEPATDAEGLPMSLNAKREKIARTATNRNMLLLFLGYSARVPQCEKEGTADPTARKAYLCGVPCAFTKSDRSMAVQAATGEWHLAVDEWWQPAVYATKAAALAAGRRAEQRHDALAKVAPPPAGMVGARARASWRKADRARGLDRAEERRYAY